MFIFVEDSEPLVEIVDGVLYAIHWSSAASHALDEMSQNLNDATYLYNYFEQHRDGLDYFKQVNSTQDAVIRTQKEADELLQELLYCCEQSEKGEAFDLDELFEPLHKDSAYNHPRFYTDFKLKGATDNAPWVRLYAIKCDSNMYVITGYGIKLVQDMRDDSLLVQELKKLEIATAYLKQIGILG